MIKQKPEDLVCETVAVSGGLLGVITLTRPQALNSLSLEMCQTILDTVQEWDHDNHVQAIVMRGTGDRAFCAGGDIKYLYHSGREAPAQAALFFQCEYQMNKAIYHLSKPYISLLHGITMGGGVGISAHGSYRVGSDTLMWAMPETGIGFFPDVGAGYVLSRCLPPWGLFLGLTGYRLTVADAYHLGLVTHVLSGCAEDDVMAALKSSDWREESHTVVQQVLNAHSAVPGASPVMQHTAVVESAFSHQTVEEVVASLEQSTDPFAAELLSMLSSKSPMSLKVTMAQVLKSASMAFDAVMEMEFNIAYAFLCSQDFYEGVRAAVIDKDRAPQWHYAQLSDVSGACVAGFFEEQAMTLDG